MADKFDKAVSIVQGLPKDGPIKPSQDQQLKFYGLYKAATVGEVNTPRPGMMDFVGKAKWDAWKSRSGLSSDEAKEEYVKLLKEVLEKADNEDAKKYLEELQ